MHCHVDMSWQGACVHACIAHSQATRLDRDHYGPLVGWPNSCTKNQLCVANLELGLSKAWVRG